MHVLVVDDEKRMVESLIDYLKLEGIEAHSALDGLEARDLLSNETFDAVVTDLRMPGLSGLELLKWINSDGPALPAIMISAHGEVADAVEAMKLGAYDYLVKPFAPEELVLRLRKAVSQSRSAGKASAGARKYEEGKRLIGESPAMKEVERLIAKAAPSTATILITGESGTGKEVAAQMIHELSGREGPFVAINVGAMPENLLESELFGHEKGAFTGAEARKLGLFEAAQGGTLFLDEIGDLPLHLQVKVLRAIQERKILRLGATRSLPVDVRLLAATNRDLETEVREGRFREDLYYRLNVIGMRLPPLRERRSDIGILAGFFFRKLSVKLGRKLEGLSPEALALLESYPFPGNVRELENAMERAIILAEGPYLEARDFAFASHGQVSRAAMAGGGDYFASPRSLAEIEKKAIEASLRRNAWHRERTASELGMTRRTLLNKIKEYDIDVAPRAGEEEGRD